MNNQSVKTTIIEHIDNRDLQIKVGGTRSQGYFNTNLPEKPLITIITSVLNNADLLNNTIKSVLCQSYDNYEYIIIDGGSSDGTINIIENYGIAIDYWISEPDNGIYDAWNKGLSVARGSWISFLGAGDTYAPNALEEYFQYIQTHQNIDLVTSLVELYSLDGSSRILGKKWSWHEFKHHMLIGHVGALHSKTLFNNYGLFDQSFDICGDYELLLRAGPNLVTHNINKVLARMLAGGKSSSESRVFREVFRAKRIHQSVNLLEAIYDYLIAYLKWCIRKATTNI